MNNLTESNIKQSIISLTIPGYYGMLGMSIFNIVDTFFVGQLGHAQLAAMAFTFPIVMIVNLITVGLGIGIAALISRAVGEKDHDKVQHTVMTGLIISIILSLIITIGGLLTIEPVFSFLGASSETIVLIKSYMVVWYIGSVFLFLTMIMGQMFRGLGDTKTPARLMIISAVLNTILDPIFIFGFLFIPSLGIMGAAIATVISRVVVTVFYFYYLKHRYDALTISKLKIKQMLTQAKEIISVGIPNSLSKVVNPLIVAFVTALLATQSEVAVGGYGVATKVEALILALAIAFGNTTTAIIGQNFGAKKYDRIKEAMNLINRYSIYIFAVVYVLVYIFAPFLAQIFTKDETAIHITTLYLRIVALSYGFQSIYQSTVSFLNVLRHPYVATFLSFAQFILILIPLSYLLAPKFAEIGVFSAIAISYIVLGIVCYFLDKFILEKITK